jgi:hypothetical protein
LENMVLTSRSNRSMAWSVNASAELKGDRDEGGTAALLLIAGDMLGRRPSGLTGKLREAGLMRLMQAMPTPGIDADRPDMVQALDQAEHRGGLRRLRHLAKPNEPALPAFRPALRQRIQLSALLVGQADGQPPLDLPPRPKAEIATEAFEAPRRRNDNLSPAALLHNQLGQMKEAIVLEGLRMKGLGEFGRGVFSEGAEPVLQFGGMPAAILLGDEIAIDGLRMHVDLFGDKRDQRRRRPLIGPQRPPLGSAGSTASAHSRGGCDCRGGAGSSRGPSPSACNGEPAHVAPWADRTVRRSGSRSIVVGALLMLP